MPIVFTIMEARYGRRYRLRAAYRVRGQNLWAVVLHRPFFVCGGSVFPRGLLRCEIKYRWASRRRGTRPLRRRFCVYQVAAVGQEQAEGVLFALATRRGVRDSCLEGWALHVPFPY